MKPLINQAIEFINEYQTTFDTKDMDAFSKYFSEPFISVRPDGTVQSMPSNESASAFFKTVLKQWQKEGYSSFSTKDFELTPIGSKSMLVTFTWEMLDSSKQLIREWRQSYNLLAKGDSWLVISSTFHN